MSVLLAVVEPVGVDALSGVTASDAVAGVVGMFLAGLCMGLVARLTR